MPFTKAKLLRRLFDAYKDKQRGVLEDMFTEDFRFTSFRKPSRTSRFFRWRGSPASRDRLDSPTLGPDIARVGYSGLTLYQS